MIQRQHETGGRMHPQHNQDTLRKRHPVLLPLLLLAGSCTACFLGFSTENIFPLLALLGISSSTLCISLALVLGISGILTGIISVIEWIDRRGKGLPYVGPALSKEQRF